jgi:hypothetical protein
VSGAGSQHNCLGKRIDFQSCEPRRHFSETGEEAKASGRVVGDQVGGNAGKLSLTVAIGGNGGKAVFSRRLVDVVRLTTEIGRDLAFRAQTNIAANPLIATLYSLII